MKPATYIHRLFGRHSFRRDTGECVSKKSPSPKNAGFTMMEIILVLCLLGTLSAVAAVKYFDLRDKGLVYTCEHNRAVLARVFLNLQAEAVLKDGTLLKSLEEANELANKANTLTLESIHDDSLCTGTISWNVFKTSDDGFYSMTVNCSKHDAPLSTQ